jgi:hypothetical protein
VLILLGDILRLPKFDRATGPSKTDVMNGEVHAEWVGQNSSTAFKDALPTRRRT